MQNINAIESSVLSIIVTLTILLGVLLGCSKSISNTKPIVQVDINGYKYILVSNSVLVSNGTKTMELWKRVLPEDTNVFYMKTLSSEVDTNRVPMFISVPK